MPTVGFRATRSRRVFVNAPVVRKVLEQALDNEVKPHFIAALEKFTANWKNKPDFAGRKYITADSIKVTVHPTGNKQIYTWVTKGTKGPYKIPKTPKSGVGRDWLFYRKGYVAKTGPGASWYGGPGRAFGSWVRARQVEHPGIKPRDFEGRVRKREAPWFSRTMNNAWKRAIRAMQSG